MMNRFLFYDQSLFVRLTVQRWEEKYGSLLPFDDHDLSYRAILRFCHFATICIPFAPIPDLSPRKRLP